MISISCRKHPKYKAVKFPTTNCYGCVKLYDLSRETARTNSQLKVTIQTGDKR